MKIDLRKIQEHRSVLENHSLLNTNVIQEIEDLRIFMKHHVYAVWDFMSLLKTCQNAVVPSGKVWLPSKGTRSDVARMINEIVLCEESDTTPDKSGNISHFDLYLQSMLEVGADIEEISAFVEHYGIFSDAPPFTQVTMKHIEQGVHCAAASFTFGRETVIPAMFKRILRQLNINDYDAPKFHYYLERHIEVDGDEHGPLAEKMVNYFCEDNPRLIHEAEVAAIEAIKARIELFDTIEEEILNNK